MFPRIVKSREDSVRDVQSFINMLLPSTRQIDVDGIVGPKTLAAFRSLGVIPRGSVQLLNLARGDVLNKLPEGRAPVRAPARARATVNASSTQSSIKDKIKDAAQKFGVNPTFALTVANAESAFNPNATSSTGYKGVFQLGRPAVVDVKRAFPQHYYEPPGGSWYNADWNIMVGVLYLRVCAAYAAQAAINSVNAKRLALSDQLDRWARIYAAFNVGVGTLRNIDAGRYTAPAAVNAVQNQAAILRKDGVRGYLANAARYLQSKLTRA